MLLSEQLAAALSSECAAQASHYDHLLRCLEHPARRAERIVSLRRRYAVRAPFRRWRSLIAEILIAVQSARRARDLDAARRCFARWLELHQRWVFVRGVLRGVADGARRGRIFARWADGAAEARRCRDGAALIASALGKLYCPAVCFAAWRRFNHTARRNRRIVARGAVQVARRIAREHFASWRGWHARFAALRLRASSSRMHAVRTRCSSLRRSPPPATCLAQCGRRFAMRSCAGRKPPFWGLSARHAHTKSTVQTRLAVGDTEGA
jgi:hypothetical protein